MFESVTRKVIRKYEINAIKQYFSPGMSVLEIGGGDGYQASIMTSWGCNVISVDIETDSDNQQFYPVMKYDGRSLPFANETYDLVITSNVLEHVTHLDELLSEMKRVMKQQGIAIHIIPSTSWRLWTLIAHYPYLVMRVSESLFNMKKNNFQHNSGVVIGVKSSYLSKFVAGPHGEFANAFVELYYFSCTYWNRLFLRNDFQLLKVENNKLFYTGYHLLNKVSINWREKLAVLLGASCNIFVLKKNPQ